MNVIELSKDLIGCNSVSANSNVEIANFLEEKLNEIDFETERIEYIDNDNVQKVNIVGRKGRGDGGFVLCGHTDTVPAEGWDVSPFSAFVKDGKLYGRGSCDMKGAVASMLCAGEKYKPSELAHPLYLLLTCDEEIGCIGVKEIVNRSKLLKESPPRYGVICEPTSLNVIHAHKGVIQFHAVAKGKAAHSSTGKGINANLKMIPFLYEMRNIYEMLTTNEEHFNCDFDPPFADWNITFSDDDTAANVTTPLSRSIVNFRPMPTQDVEPLIARVLEVAEKNDVQVEVRNIGAPLLTPAESKIVLTALDLTGQSEPKTVSYATDGIVLGSLMELIILGPGDIVQAHTVGEWIEVEQLYKAVEIYAKFIERFCLSP